MVKRGGLFSGGFGGGYIGSSSGGSRDFHSILRLENKRRRGEAPAGTPTLTLDQVLSKSDVIPETLQSNADLLEFLAYYMDLLFSKVIESSAWAQQHLKTPQAQKITCPYYAVPIVGASERIRFNFISTEIITGIVQYSPGEDVILSNRGINYIFNVQLYKVFVL